VSALPPSVLQVRSSAGMYGADRMVLTLNRALAAQGVPSRLLSINNYRRREQSLPEPRVTPASDLLALARTTTGAWPALWLPPILSLLVQGLALGDYAHPAVHAVVATSACLAALLVEAGWLAMIGRALTGAAPTMDDFNQGVNARWLPILAGNVALIVGLGALAGAVYAIGDAQYGWKALQAWFDSIKDLPPEALRKAVDPEKLPAAVQGWFFDIAMGLGVAGLASLALTFWKALVVLGGRTWWAAFGGSVALVVRRFGFVVAASIAQVGGVLSANMWASGGNPVGGLFGLVGYMAITVYFTVLYAAIARDSLPETPPDGPAVDTRA